MSLASGRNDILTESLIDVLGPAAVITDEEERKFYSSDVYARGETCAVVLRPKDKENLSKAVRIATEAGYAVNPRGGGMSYTKGYIPIQEATVLIDLGEMNQIIEINEEDMTVTAEAGVTWQQLYEALRPQGLRLPFFGTLSGSRATVGGGLSNGALFLGTARYGTAADNVLGMEVVLADGTTVTTGQASFHNGKPFYRTYGPDFTGLFCHDVGAFGIKVRATFRLIRWPKENGYASFAFPDVKSVAFGLSEVAKSGLAEECYVFDPQSTRQNLANVDLFEGIKTLAGVVKGQSGLGSGLKEGAKLIVAGRDFVEEGAFSLHVVCAGNSKGAVNADLNDIRLMAARHGGEEIANSIPKAVRADPFKPLNSVLGPGGTRWAALNAKVTHSDAHRIIEEFDELLDPHRAEMAKHGVSISRLLIGISTHAFSFEPVFHWTDEWLPLHKHVPESSYLKRFAEPIPNPKASELVEVLRTKTVQMFAELGAASNQIGRTYPYYESMDSGAKRILDAIKANVDPEHHLNPGSLISNI